MKKKERRRVKQASRQIISEDERLALLAYVAALGAERVFTVLQSVRKLTAEEANLAEALAVGELLARRRGSTFDLERKVRSENNSKSQKKGEAK